jgi:hypothetical protein
MQCLEPCDTINWTSVLIDLPGKMGAGIVAYTTSINLFEEGSFFCPFNSLFKALVNSASSISLRFTALMAATLHPLLTAHCRVPASTLPWIIFYIGIFEQRVTWLSCNAPNRKKRFAIPDILIDSHQGKSYFVPACLVQTLQLQGPTLIQARSLFLK